jgi:hypothetical protein
MTYYSIFENKGAEKLEQEREETTIEYANRGFLMLTKENRQKVIDMLKFLVLTQNTVIPEVLNIRGRVE